MSTLDLLTTYWPHALTVTATLLAKPTWRKARALVVLLARAIVAHEDGDDKAALKDLSQVVAALPPQAEPFHPPGTVTSWPTK